MAKDRVQELAGKLRDAARLHDPSAKAAIELVQLSLADLKESLVSAEGDDMLRMQGAARQLKKLHHELTTTPPNITPQDTQEQ